MCDRIVRDMVKLRGLIENQISLLNALKESDELIQQIDVFNYPVLIQDESRLILLKEILKKINEYIDENCLHTFVHDSIDISQGESRYIYYCDLCGKSC